MKKSRGNIAFYIICTFCFLLFIFFSYKDLSSLYVQTINEEKHINIILDAGHGGEDGGAVGGNGEVEKDINLAIVTQLKQLFLLDGFSVTTIRESDKAICDEGLDTIRERKRSDLTNRLKLYNKSKNNIVLSIHQNKFQKSNCKGAQIFYSKNNEKSEMLGEHIRTSINSLLQPENTRELEMAGENIFLMKNAEVPAVIVECGFLSNKEETQLLITTEYQNRMAYAIYLGFLDFYNSVY